MTLTGAPGPHPATSPRREVVFAALTLSAFFWGAGFSVARFALRSVSPLELLAGSALFGAISQLALSTVRRDWSAFRLPPKWLGLMIIFGLLSQNVLNGFTNLGLESTTATNAALIYGFSPVLIAVFAAFFLREQFGVAKGIGAAVGFAGVALIITQGDPGAFQVRGVMVGNLWIAGGALYWAMYAIATRFLTRQVRPEALTFHIIVLGAVLPVGAVWIRESKFCWAGVNAPTLVAMAFIGLCTATLAMNFWNWGLAHIEASKVGMFSFLEPVFAAAVALIFFGEKLTWPTAFGSALVFAGIFLSTRSRSSRVGA